MVHVAASTRRYNAVAISADGSSWTDIETGTNFHVSGLAYGNGIFMAVGSGLATSTDGVTWEARDDNDTSASGLTTQASDMIFDGSQFVVLGNGDIYASTDGSSWTQTTSSSPLSSAIALAHDSTGTYVAVGGYGGLLYHSNDLTTWSSVSTTLSDDLFVAVVYDSDNSRFVTISLRGEVYASTGGVTDWTAVNSAALPAGSYHALHYGSGRLIAWGYGSVVTSTNGGVDWTEGDTSSGDEGDVRAIGSGVVGSDPVYVAVGDYKTIYSSSDAVDWTKQVTGFGPHRYVSGTADNGAGTIVAVDNVGNAYSSDNGGAQWSAGTTTGLAMQDIIYAGGQFLGVGYAGVASSPDGVTWTTTRLNQVFRDIYHDGSAYHIVTERGNLVTSASLESFTFHAPLTTGPLTGITGNGTALVVVGDAGTVFTSPDGNTWTDHTSTSGTTANLTAVAYSDTLGLFAAVGVGGAIITSSDGATWSEPAPGTTIQDLNDVIWNGTRFVAVGNLGTVVNSANGTAWTATDTSSAGITSSLTSVAWGNARHVAVDTNGRALMSVDPALATWTLEATTTSALHAIVLHDTGSGAGRFYAVGDAGTAVSSEFTAGAGANSWTDESVPSEFGEPVSFRGLAFDGNTVIAVGAQSNVYQRNTATSAWEKTFRVGGNEDELRRVLYDGTRYVVVGNQVALSTDGAEWTFPLNPFSTVGMLNDVAYDGAGTYAAVGYDFGLSQVVLLTSTDALTWTSYDTSALDLTRLDSIAYGGSQFIAGGMDSDWSPVVLTSADGVSWTSAVVSPDIFDPVSSLIYDGSQFVGIVGRSAAGPNHVITSTEGSIWTVYKPWLHPELDHIYYDGTGTYFIGGNNGLIATHDSTWP